MGRVVCTVTSTKMLRNMKIKTKRIFRLLFHICSTSAYFISHWNRTKQISLFKSYFFSLWWIRFHNLGCVCVCDVDKSRTELISAFMPQWIRLSHQNSNESKIKSVCQFRVWCGDIQSRAVLLTKILFYTRFVFFFSFCMLFFLWFALKFFTVAIKMWE